MVVSISSGKCRFYLIFGSTVGCLICGSTAECLILGSTSDTLVSTGKRGYPMTPTLTVLYFIEPPIRVSGPSRSLTSLTGYLGPCGLLGSRLLDSGFYELTG